jgi:GTP-binding protein EngB required for normal cell division
MSEYNTPEAVNAAIDEIIALLDTKYNFDEALLKRTVVFFVGVTGVGKSTACQFLAGNPKLKAIKVESTDTFYITDGDDRVSESTTKSKTSIPEFVPIPNTDTVLVDCPGFSDTQGVKYDIADTYFTKQVLDRSEQVKIMVTTSFSSVQIGVDRTGFTKLLEHLVLFIKDIDKFKNSIGLLVTKVDKLTEEDQDENLQLIPDDRIIEGIGAFLETMKSELIEANNDNINAKQIEFVNIFTEKNANNEYSRIGIFRIPTNDQNVHTNRRLKKNKKDINNIMNNIILSSHTTPNDFGLSLSRDSIIFVAKMRESLKNRLPDIIDEYTRVYCQQQLHYASNLESIKTAISRSRQVVDLLQTKVDPNSTVVTDLLESIQKLDPNHLAQLLTDWKHQQNYLQTLESISPSEEKYNDFIRYQEQFAELENQITKNIKKMEQNAENIVDQGISEVITEVMTTVLNNEAGNLEISSEKPYNELKKQAENIYNSWNQFKTNNLSKPKLQFKEFLNDFKEKYIMSGSLAEKLDSYQKEIDFLKKNASMVTVTDGHQLEWLQGFSVLLNEINRIVEWYTFITASYAKLIEYDSNNMITKDMGYWKNWTNFKALQKQLGTDAKSDKFLESHLTLSKNEQIDLNNLIDSIQSSLEASCESSKLIVKDNLVLFSKMINDIFPKCQSFKELYIFASQTVFIDESLALPGKNVYLFAPTWNIVGTQTINLRGSEGGSKDRSRSGLETDVTGHPGQPGGNFIGIGDDFVKGQSLTVDVSGGNGGKGVDGVDGENGNNGKFKFDQNWKLFGTNGTVYKNVTDGEIAGFGGKPGTIFVNSPKINKLVNLGRIGAVGIGGKGGKGGEHGKVSMCTSLSSPMFREVRECKNIMLESIGEAANGADGVFENPKYTAQPHSFVPLHLVAQEYKQYARQKQSPFVEPLKFVDHFVSNDFRRRRSVHTSNGASPPFLAIDHQSRTLENKSWSMEFSLSSFAMLADMVIRKFMKTSPTNVESQADPTLENLLIRGKVLNILERFKDKINEVNQKDGPQQKNFDPVCLQKELTRLIRESVNRSDTEAEIMGKLFSCVH